MTCWFQRLPTSSTIRRAMMSLRLPAPNGTTSVTRWVGKVCADAGVAKMAASMAATPRETGGTASRRISCAVPLLDLGSPAAFAREIDDNPWDQPAKREAASGAFRAGMRKKVWATARP